MKASATINYAVEDVFYIFTRSAKRDFKDFKEESPKGSKITKNIGKYKGKPVECTIEITDFIKNEKYEITTSSEFSKCKSTYEFKTDKDGKTIITFEETQGSESIFSLMGILFQRFLAKRQFKSRFNNIIENLEAELKTYLSNVERSKPKNKEEWCTIIDLEIIDDFIKMW